MITLYINDQAVDAEPETTVLQTARSHGITVPTLCHHPALKPSGSCKICAVAVEKVTGDRTIMLSCLLKVKPGMRLWTQGAEVRQALRANPLPDGRGFLAKHTLVAAYRGMVEAGEWEEDPVLLAKIRMKPIRTLSGVTTITILTKPFPCPGECIFLPE